MIRMRFAWTLSIVVVLCLSALPAFAQRPQPRPTARAEAPAPVEMTMAGIRVVREGAGADGSELRAFNWSSGTDLEVFVRTGRPTEFIVAVDDDESVVENFTDDAGGGLAQGAEVDSFPKVAADGSVALVTLSSDAVPGAGATAVTVSGQLALTTSTGSKVQKIPGVKIESAKTFKLGAATVTIEDVTSDSERTTFTLTMTRATRNLIKEVVFKNAKGEVLDVSTNGYSIMNETAQLNYAGPGGLTTATLEADLWQNLKVRKAPFKITATLGGEK